MATHDYRTISKLDCPHLNELNPAQHSDKTACETCGETRNLRLCMTCGHVGCCESLGAHDTEHHRATTHPFIRPHRCDYEWLWCYDCGAFLA